MTTTAHDFYSTMVCEDDGAQAITFGGALLSTVGYSLAVATAVTFKEWRNKVSNQVWLYMCGSNLLFIYFLAFYCLCKCKHLSESCMESDIWHAAFWMLTDYCALTSCSWFVAGAWLAQKRILTAMRADFKRPPVGVCVFSLLIPIPFCLVRFFYMRPQNPVRSTLDMFPLMYQLLMVSEKVFCMCLYSRILYVVYRGNKDYGRKRLVETSVLVIVFLMLSGLQYALVMAINIGFEYIEPRNAVMFRWMTGLVTCGVFFYSTFIFCFRDTRTLWVECLQRKLKIVFGKT